MPSVHILKERIDFIEAAEEVSDDVLIVDNAAVNVRLDQPLCFDIYSNYSTPMGLVRSVLSEMFSELAVQVGRCLAAAFSTLFHVVVMELVDVSRYIILEGKCSLPG